MRPIRRQGREGREGREGRFFEVEVKPDRNIERLATRYNLANHSGWAKRQSGKGNEDFRQLRTPGWSPG